LIAAISAEVDFGDNVGSIRYREGALGSIVSAAPCVLVEYDSGSQVLGIELRALDHATLLAARNFTEANDLEFPVFFRSCIKASEDLYGKLD
jgi:hypothetical protein